MQDCYVGDVGDFGKYGLLLSLSNAGLSPVGIVWYLVPEDKTAKANDGKHISYLNERKQRRYESCNLGLYQQLHSIVMENQRCVAAIRSRRLLGENAQFFEKEVPRNNRDAWLRDALNAVTGCKLIFLDPDNGLIVNHPRDRRKYIEEHELEKFIQTNATVILYQHLHRSGKSEDQAAQLRQRVQSLSDSKLDIQIIRFRRGTSRFFVVIGPSTHRSIVEQGISEFMTSFAEHAERVHVGGIASTARS